MKQIVLARAERTALIPTGRHVMRDMNWFPEFRSDWEARAGMWMRKGSAKDLQKAKEHAAKEGWEVFTFAPTERDPLGKARERVVALARKTEATAR